jgi:hypothetical protein
MTALGISLAVVVVAFVARDVALRVLADRARERGRARGNASRITALEMSVDPSLGLRVAALEKLDAEGRLGDLSAKVERLLARENMKGLR